ncbi:hypothetical protein NCC49_004260 [Naganishia albida]|nr:hypothetical protein NCC49_004260 [Naganishia albida]
MRTPLYLTALAASLVALTSASTHHKPIQVFLHPAPSALESYQQTHEHAPVLSADQAQAVFSHHLGALSLTGGVDEFEKLPEGHEGWVHMLGDWDSPGSVSEANKGRVVIIQGDIEVQDVLPSTISTSPTFYLSSTSSSVKTFLQPYINRAEQVVDHILDSLDLKENKIVQWLGDVFTQSTSETSKILHDQLEALSALASRMPWNDKSAAHDSTWESIIVNAFGGSSDSEETTLGSEVQQAGYMGVKGALKEMTSEDQPPLILVIMPASGSSSVRLARRAYDAEDTLEEIFATEEKQEDAFDTETPETVEPAVSFANSSRPADADPMCFPSNRTCDYASSSCSGHGECVLVSNSTKESRTGECWACKCASGYLGAQCQKGDYVFQTILLVFTPLLLLTVALMSVALLSGIGGEKLPSTLNLSMGGGHKRD